MNSVEQIKKHANSMRKLILEMGYQAGNHAAHLGGALSCVDALATIYFGVSNIIAEGMKSASRDRIILSKGHSSLALYAALIEAGIMPENLKDTFEDDNSCLLGHPVINRELGIEFTNGSLGMGLSLAIGVALACKKRKLNNRIFVILGDGECDEGSCWEAFMSAAKFKLDNLIMLIDCNGYQLSGSTDDVMPLSNLNAQLQMFGWNSKEINGHNIAEILSELEKSSENEKPNAIVLKTIKGKGFSFSEGNNSWHHAIVTQKIYEQGVQELKEL